MTVVKSFNLSASIGRYEHRSTSFLTEAGSSAKDEKACWRIRSRFFEKEFKFLGKNGNEALFNGTLPSKNQVIGPHSSN